MKYFIVASFFFLFISCDKSKYMVTEDYIFNGNGFSEGFTVQLLKVYDFDSAGLPKTFKDSLRVDLNYSGEGKVKRKIWFFKDNGNYFWTRSLENKYSVMPITFEKGSWYAIWSNKFTSGLFKSDIHNFFLYRDSSGKLNIFERVTSTNL